MAVTGAKPKADRSQVRHRIQPVYEWTEVEDVPFADGPRLPTRDVILNPDDGEDGGETVKLSWPASTKRWWDTVRRMPHAKLWSDADWEFAFATAEVHARTAEGRRSYTGAELRQREKLMGVFADARRDLRIRYVPAKTAAELAALPDNVRSMNDFRGL